MSRLVILFLSLLWATAAAAERKPIPPSEVEPLTRMPWKKPGATLPGVLEAIFREPDVDIRDTALQAYLEIIPVEQFGEALDLSVELVGEQPPSALVAD